MSSKPQPGKPGTGQNIAVIAVIVFASHADKAWLTVFLGVIVAYAIVVDWLGRRR